MPPISIAPLNVWFKKRRKYLATVILIPAAFCAAIALYGHIDLYLANRAWVAAGGWLEEPKPVSLNIPDEENAAYYYAQAGALLDEDESPTREWLETGDLIIKIVLNIPIDNNAIASVTRPEAMDEVLDLIHQGVQMAKCDSPAIFKSKTPQFLKDRFPELDSYKLQSRYRVNYWSFDSPLPRSLVLEALSCDQRGESQRAADLLLMLSRLSNHQKPSTCQIEQWNYPFTQQQCVSILLMRMFEDSNIDLSGFLDTLHIDDIHQNQINEYIDWADHQIRYYGDPEQALSNPKGKMDFMAKWMYRFDHNPNQLIWGLAPGAANMDIATTRRIYTQELINLQKPYHTRQPIRSTNDWVQWKLLTRRVGRPGSGDDYYASAITHMSWVITTRLAIQLRQYRTEHGQYPESLSDQTIPAPIDPGNGKPIDYQRTKEGFILTAVGAQRKHPGKIPGDSAPIVWTWK